ncbi:Hypothetical protein NTJ_08752 [Nesidiocoris tenuis]|uniref:Uncharacterized protein n=1 Tax=Nesidiocoris tenuis TaxID=355587 RepID=A0ABN7AVB2_9HEMI|nr:Hypothetical protein NTJ_08752 [Nesidiocoris tenuis]
MTTKGRHRLIPPLHQPHLSDTENKREEVNLLWGSRRVAGIADRQAQGSSDKRIPIADSISPHVCEPFHRFELL